MFRFDVVLEVVVMVWHQRLLLLMCVCVSSFFKAVKQQLNGDKCTYPECLECQEKYIDKLIHFFLCI